MSNDIKVQGIRITLDDAASPVVEDTAIGLYNVTSDNSQFRWISNTVTGLTGWATGMILEDGISSWVRSIDLGSGGNVASPSSFSCSIKNTALFYKSIKDLEVELVGLKIELVEYINGTETVRETGKISSCSWTLESFEIQAEGAYNDRDASITTQDIEGNTKPVHFGKFDGSTGYNYAKCVKTAFKNLNIKGSDIPGVVLTGVDSDNETFCIVSGDNHYSDSAAPSVVVGVAKSLLLISSSTVAAFLVGKYISVVTGQNSGEIRRILSIDDYDEANGTITLELSAAFATTFTALADNWCNIIDFSMTLSVDSQPSLGFTGSLSDFFIYNNGYSKQANLLFDVSNTYSANPVIDFASGNISSLKTFIMIKPEISVGDTDTVYWGGFFVGKYRLLSSCAIGSDGFYYTTTNPPVTKHFDNPLNAVDQDISTFLSMYNTVDGSDILYPGRYFLYLLDLYIGNSVKGISYDNAYLMYSSDILDTAYLVFSAQSTNTARRRFYGKEYVGSIGGVPYLIWTYNWNICGSVLNSVPFDNIIDYYVGRTDYNKKFMQYGVFWNLPTDGLEDSVIRMQFQLTANATSPGTLNVGIKINELAIALEKTIDLNDGFYCKFNGRIFNDTWGSRKTSATLIESPLDVLEHILRLGNWSESDSVPTGGWGTAYAANAKIKTSGVGSFDSTERGLDVLRTIFKACRGVYNYDDARVLALAKSICQEFDLILWVDKDGYYCIDRYVPSYSTSGLTNITLADIPFEERGNISVEYANPSDIYCEPFIRYNWDEGAQKYQSIIKVRNAGAATYDPAYVEGVTGEFNKEQLWNRCHLLWKRCRMITEPPSEITDTKWLNGVWAYDMALERFNNWLDQQGYARISLTVNIEKAIAWQEGTRFSVQLPHQTNDLAVECMVEEIECSRSSNTASIKAVMFLSADTPIAETEIWDTMTVLADQNTYQDTYSTGDEYQDVI